MVTRIGHWSALALTMIGIVYAAITLTGMIGAGLARPIVGPVLTAMEALTLLAAPLLVVLFAAVQATANAPRRIFGNIALVFAALAAGATAAVHFVSLTAMRQTGQQVLSWPSPLYAVELLAWDLFLGLALLACAQVYTGSMEGRRIRRGLQVAGSLCLIGLTGPLSGDMRLQFVAVFGYGVLLPVIWLLMALDFAARGKRDPA